jgi:ABC-type sulfate/molybdate transport systems ATPase subunit
VSALRFVGAGIRRDRRTPGAHLLGPCSLELTAPETVVLFGPSGAGKSLLIELASGLRAPDVGRVVRDDVDLHRIPAARRGVGLLTQDAALYDHLDTRGNITFGAGVTTEDAEAAAGIARCSELLAGTPRPVDTLSGGERRRVALAKALAGQPELLLLDEPFEGLDPGTHRAIRLALREALRQRDAITIIAVHDRADAIALADRVVLLDGGQVLAADRPRTLLDAPASLEVATTFTHPDAAVLAGTVNGNRLELPGGSIEHASDEHLDGAVRVVVPREAVRRGERGLTGWSVRAHEPTESGCDLVCSHDDGGTDDRPLRIAVPEGDPLPAPGTPIGLELKPTAVHVYPSVSVTGSTR